MTFRIIFLSIFISFFSFNAIANVTTSFEDAISSSDKVALIKVLTREKSSLKVELMEVYKGSFTVNKVRLTSTEDFTIKNFKINQLYFVLLKEDNTPVTTMSSCGIHNILSIKNNKLDKGTFSYRQPYLGQNISKLSQAIKKKVMECHFIPENGYVPNKETAIKVAVASWVPIYGKKQIKDQKPYSAKLNNNIWSVSGSLPQRKKGGVAYAEIDKKTGKILKISHGK